MKLLSLLAAAPLVALVGLRSDPLLDKNVSALKNAPSLIVKFRVNVIGGAAEDQVLTLSKPNMMVWETPTKTTICDGKTLTQYTKATKTYTQESVGDDWGKKALSSDEVWAWSAFFNSDIAKELVNTKKGQPRNVKGIAATEVIVTRGERGAYTLMLDNASGLARGASYKDKAGADVVIQSTEVTVGKEPLDAAKFTWTAPEGASLAKKEDLTKVLGFADVQPIFAQRCTGCHSGSGAKAGLDLSNYDSIMASGKVQAGNADGSRLVRVLKQGKMPPGRPLDQDSVDKIAKWVADGAKN